MRRKDKEILDRDEINEIIMQSDVCRLSMCNDNQPYLVPMSFGYDGINIFLHSSKKGKRIEMLQKNNQVCFEFDTKVALVRNEKPCDWGCKYYSVIGFGRVSFIETVEEKIKALNCIMKQYGGTSSNFFPGEMLAKTELLKIEISEISGKKSGY